MLAVLLGLALCIGVVTASVTAGLPAFLPMLFTPDRRLWPLMRTVAPQVRSTPAASTFTPLSRKCCSPACLSCLCAQRWCWYVVQLWLQMRSSHIAAAFVNFLGLLLQPLHALHQAQAPLQPNALF